MTALLLPAELEIKSWRPRKPGSGSCTAPWGLQAILREASLAGVCLERARPQGERSCSQFLCRVWMLHTLLGTAEVTGSLSPALLNPGKQMDVPRCCLLLSSSEMKDFQTVWKEIFGGCFKSELLCAKATREPRAGNIGFGKQQNRL